MIFHRPFVIASLILNIKDVQTSSTERHQEGMCFSMSRERKHEALIVLRSAVQKLMPETFYSYWGCERLRKLLFGTVVFVWQLLMRKWSKYYCGFLPNSAFNTFTIYGHPFCSDKFNKRFSYSCFVLLFYFHWPTVLKLKP